MKPFSVYIILWASTLRLGTTTKFRIRYSRIANEFSANNLIIIDITIYAAIIVTIYLLFISIRFKKLFI